MMQIEEDTLASINAQLQKRRLKLSDAFADFDKLRSGRVTANQFRRVMKINDIALTDEQLEVMLNWYGKRQADKAISCNNKERVMKTNASNGNNVDAVYYQQFLSDLNELNKTQSIKCAANNKDTIDAIHKGAMQHTNAARLSDATTSSCLTPEQIDRLEPTLKLLRHVVRTNGIDVISPFRDFDPLRTFKVTKSQFVRSLTLPRIDDHVLALLCAKYGDGNGNVYYMHFCQDIDDTLASNTHEPEYYNNTNNNNEYSSAFSGQREEQQEEYQTRPLVQTGIRINDGLDVGVDCSKNDTLSALQLIRILREQSALYRLRAEDYFTDFDPMQKGKVTLNQFESALGRLQLVKFTLTARNIAQLVEYYTIRTGKTPNVFNVQENTQFARSEFVAPINPMAIEIDYKRFLSDIDPRNDFAPTVTVSSYTTQSNNYNNSNPMKEKSHESFQLPSQFANTTTSHHNYFISSHAPNAFLQDDNENEAVDALLTKVRRLARSSRIALSPVLRDFDRVTKSIYEHRTCTASRFARGLATQKILLPFPELQLLLKKYTIPNADGSPSGEINYYQFVCDVEDDKEGKRAASNTINSQSYNNANYNKNQTRNYNSERESESLPSLESVLQKIANQADKRHLRVDEFFSDFDSLHGHHIAPTKFITALTIAGLHLAQDELHLLTQSYLCDRFPNEIDLLRFMNDVHDYAPQAVPSMTTNMKRNKLSQSHVQATESATTDKKNYTNDNANKNIMSTDKNAKLNELLRRLRHNTQTHGALLTPFFADFDHHHTGKITPNQFHQALCRHRFTLSEEELQMLIVEYTSPSSESAITNTCSTSSFLLPTKLTGAAHDVIDYHRFVRDVGCDEESGVNESTMPYWLYEQKEEQQQQQQNDDRNDATYNIATTAITTPSSTTINNNYEKDEGNVNVDKVDLCSVMQKICAFVQQRRPRLREFFHDGDELRHGCVSAPRFRHCLSILGLDLNENEWQLLEATFSVNVAVNEKMISYPAFIDAVEQEMELLTNEKVGKVNTSTLSSTSSASDTQNEKQNNGVPTNSLSQKLLASLPRINESVKHQYKTSTRMDGNGDDSCDLERVLRFIQRTLKSRRATSLPAFREYDRSRRGKVTSGQFFACLLSLGVTLSPQQARTISSACEIGNGEMDYVAFASCVDEGNIYTHDFNVEVNGNKAMITFL